MYVCWLTKMAKPINSQPLTRVLSVVLKWTFQCQGLDENADKDVTGTVMPSRMRERIHIYWKTLLFGRILAKS